MRLEEEIDERQQTERNEEKTITDSLIQPAPKHRSSAMMAWYLCARPHRLCGEPSAALLRGKAEIVSGDSMPTHESR